MRPAIALIVLLLLFTGGAITSGSFSSARDSILFFASAPLRIPPRSSTARPRPCQKPPAVFVRRLRACVSDLLAPGETAPAPMLAPGAAATALNPSATLTETAPPGRLRIPGIPPSKLHRKIPIPGTSREPPVPDSAAPPASLVGHSPVYSNRSPLR